MAGWFAHLHLAGEVMKNLPKDTKDIIAKSGGLNEFLFGAIAPDITWVRLGDSNRSLTHSPRGCESVFDAFPEKNAFLAGYETHLIADLVWAGDSGTTNIWESFNANPNIIGQKLGLYLLIDDYFQGKSNWFLPAGFAAMVLPATTTKYLESLGFNILEINAYKTAMFLYLKEPGLNSANNLTTAFRVPVEESIINHFMNRIPVEKESLDYFEKESVNTCIEKLREILGG